MKTIVAKWVSEEEFGYGRAMRVIESDHPRFVKGTRFDFGFMNIATEEGYTVISLPMDEVPNVKLSDGLELRRQHARHISTTPRTGP